MATHVRNEKKQIFLSVVVLIIAVFTIFGIFIVKSNPILSNYKNVYSSALLFDNN